MASAVVSEVPEHTRGPRHSLSVETPGPISSSPFPSPSSSFIPPPMPGAHEFAVPPRKKSLKSADDLEPDTSPPAVASKVRQSGNFTADCGASTGSGSGGPNGIRLLPSNIAQQPEAQPPPVEVPDADDFISPVSPTPTNKVEFSQADSTHKLLDAPQAPSSAATTPVASTIQLPPISTFESEVSSGPSRPVSLASSRPAPPSPAISRRASGAPSARSISSRPVSTALSTRRSLPPSIEKPEKRRSILVKIRDFAFNSTDDRFAGCGTDVPRPNRVKTLLRALDWERRKRNSSMSESEGSDTGEDEDSGDSWNGFKWGFNRLSMSTWGMNKDGGKDDASYTPSNNDFARNFGEDDADEEDEETGEEEWADAVEGEDPPLVPGLYRALYAFEPEGTAEMALTEEQVVRVVGRGGGVGWAVVDGESGHALVPESYLELVEADESER